MGRGKDCMSMRPDFYYVVAWPEKGVIILPSNCAKMTKQGALAAGSDDTNWLHAVPGEWTTDPERALKMVKKARKELAVELRKRIKALKEEPEMVLWKEEGPLDE